MMNAIFTQVIENPADYMDLKTVILAIFALAEAAVRLTPSESDNSLVNKIVLLGTYLLDFIIPNKRKAGGRFTVKDNV